MPKTALPGAVYVAVFEALVLVGVVSGIDYQSEISLLRGRMAGWTL